MSIKMLARGIRSFVAGGGRVFSSSAAAETIIPSKEITREAQSRTTRTARATPGAARPAIGRKETLGRRLFALLNANRSNAVAIIRKWKEDGHTVAKNELNRVVRELRRLKRYDHALQICDWMEAQKDFELQPGDYAVRVDLVAKVHGLDRAEFFFHSMPETMKGPSTFTALLHTYVQKKESAKAEALMKKMESGGFLINAHPYNRMISLYILIGQFDRVPEMINELKKHTKPNIDTYNLWLTACAAQNDIETAEKAFVEIKEAKILTDWVTYGALAGLYVKEKLFEKATSALLEMEKRAFNIHRTPYPSLISMHASVGNKEEVLRVWSKIKLYFGMRNSSEYTSMMSALVKLNLFKKAEGLYGEWVSAFETKDCRIPNILLAGYINKQNMEAAEGFYVRMVGSGVSPSYTTWELLTWGYLKAKQTKKAVKCFRKAVRKVRVWDPDVKLIREVFGSLEKDGDVEGAEEVLTVLRKAKFVNTEMYSRLLRTYAKAEKKPPPSVKKCMEEDKVEPDEETRELMESTSRMG